MTFALQKMPPYQRAIAKGHLGSCGYSYAGLSRPIIGIVNSWNDIVPGHCHLRELADEVRSGILNAGGQPLEFNTIAICDGIAQGHAGMRYSLPSRELIADTVEAMVNGHGIFDGLVFLGTCDKIVPAMLMAAARLNLPSLMVTGGPMQNRVKPYVSKAARRNFLRGAINEEELFKVTVDYYPSAGACPFLGTANTMCMVAEALGFSLSGSALIPSLSRERKIVAYESGRRVMRLVSEDIRPRAVMTREAFENAMTMVAASGGSLNTFLHVPAIAYECGIRITPDDFDAVGRKTPLLARVVPNSQEYTVADLYPVGGVPTIMKELLPVLHAGTMTVDGTTLSENVRNAPAADGTIIRPFSAPFEPEGGIAVLRGNLAPEGAVLKSSAVPGELWSFRGAARVFESEEECMAAVDAGTVQEGDVVVVRNEGPRGGPGMREMHRVSEVLAKFKKIALVTDGRFSGASSGLAIGYLSPEAAAGGPVALVRNGDLIVIDIAARRLDWDVTPEEAQARAARHQGQPRQAAESGLLRLYAGHASSASAGAVRNI